MASRAGVEMAPDPRDGSRRRPDDVNRRDFGLSSLTAKPSGLGGGNAPVGNLTSNPRADLYSLGVMLYEMVTGRAPFVGTSSLQVISQHLHAPVVPPRRYRPDLRASFQALILRLLAKDPEERYATAGDVAAALTALRSGDPATDALTTPALVLEALARGRLVGRPPRPRRRRETQADPESGNQSHTAR